jgi:hypothetical protein
MTEKLSAPSTRISTFQASMSKMILWYLRASALQSALTTEGWWQSSRLDCTGVRKALVRFKEVTEKHFVFSVSGES